jgi:predicted alpha/beta hydrolase family esterase
MPDGHVLPEGHRPPGIAVQGYVGLVPPVVSQRGEAAPRSDTFTVRPASRSPTSSTGMEWWYAVSRQDRMISPELQRFLAKRMNATTVEIDSGHLSMITHSQHVTELILEATRPITP